MEDGGLGKPTNKDTTEEGTDGQLIGNGGPSDAGRHRNRHEQVHWHKSSSGGGSSGRSIAPRTVANNRIEHRLASTRNRVVAIDTMDRRVAI